MSPPASPQPPPYRTTAVTIMKTMTTSTPTATTSTNTYYDDEDTDGTDDNDDDLFFQHFDDEVCCAICRCGSIPAHACTNMCASDCKARLAWAADGDAGILNCRPETTLKNPKYSCILVFGCPCILIFGGRHLPFPLAPTSLSWSPVSRDLVVGLHDSRDQIDMFAVAYPSFPNQNY